MLELLATVRDTPAIAVPKLMPFVISVALVPSAFALRQRRKAARPLTPPLEVTAITETALYQVPAEKVPVVAAERRQQSWAEPVGAPLGCCVAVKLVVGTSTLYVWREKLPDAMLPTVQPVVLVDAAGCVRLKRPALAPPWIGLLR